MLFKTAQEAAETAAKAVERLLTAIEKKSLPDILALTDEVRVLIGEVTASFPSLSREAIESMDATQLLLAEGRTDLGRLTESVGLTLHMLREWFRDGVRVEVTVTKLPQ